MEVSITEITPEEVKYKKVSTPNGPIFTLPKSEILSITYSDGEVWQNPKYAKKQRTSTSNKPHKESDSKIHFTPTPVGEKHIFGLTVGYISKQSTLFENGKRQGEPTSWIAHLDPDKAQKDYVEALAVGFTITPEFKYGIGIQTGIYYEYSTTSYKSTDTRGLVIKERTSDHALTIPLRLQYRYEIIPDLSVFIYTGPKFGIGISSKYQRNRELDNLIVEEMDFYKDEVGRQRYRFMWGVGAGIQWKHLQLRVGGDWGLSDMARYSKEVQEQMKEYDMDLKTTIIEPINVYFTYLF